MNNTDKQKKLVELLETPKEDRPKYLKFPSQIKKQLGISPLVYDKWVNDWRDLKAEEAKKSFEEPAEEEIPDDYDSEDWLRSRTPTADRALLNAVKSGSPGAQKIFYQLLDRLKEKQEVEHKIDGSTIAPAVLEALEELERQGVVKLQVQSSPLPNELCITSGQSQEKDDKV